VYPESHAAIERAASGYAKDVFPRGAERTDHDVFRRANERLLAAVGDRIDESRRIPFLCECLDAECRSTVQLSIEEFRRLRESDNRYAIVSGHPILETEHVLAVDGNVTIVAEH